MRLFVQLLQVSSPLLCQKPSFKPEESRVSVVPDKSATFLSNRTLSDERLTF